MKSPQIYGKKHTQVRYFGKEPTTEWSQAELS